MLASSIADWNIRSPSDTTPPQVCAGSPPGVRDDAGHRRAAARVVGAYLGGHSCDDMGLPTRQLPVKHQAQKASAMSAVQSPPEVQSGLEGVVAFATEIAEP